MPNAVRMYSSTSVGAAPPAIANAVAWDNLSLSGPDDGSVPEPATFVMAGAALAALAWWRRR
jgi:MYXO-CTERM domain-containing protein